MNKNRDSNVNKPRLSVVLLAVFVVSLLKPSAAYALTTIYDSGDTLAITKYHPKPIERAATHKPKSSDLNKLKTYPINSPSLSPGKVALRHHSLGHLSIPIFMIGDDAQSKRWLQQRAPQLKQLQAMGIVVNVESDAHMRQLQSIAPALYMIAASAEDIAEKINLRHYPVLISNQGIEQ